MILQPLKNLLLMKFIAQRYINLIVRRAYDLKGMDYGSCSSCMLRTFLGSMDRPAVYFLFIVALSASCMNTQIYIYYIYIYIYDIYEVYYISYKILRL